jgi:hypothetical protein
MASADVETSALSDDDTDETSEPGADPLAEAMIAGVEANLKLFLAPFKSNTTPELLDRAVVGWHSRGGCHSSGYLLTGGVSLEWLLTWTILGVALSSNNVGVLSAKCRE